jgi:hypothetical protein
MQRRLTVFVAVLGLALMAGCGGSSSKKSANTSSQPTSASTTATTSSAGAPVSKAEYEAKLVAALRPAQSAGSLAGRITSTSSAASDAKVFDQVGGIYQKAYADIKPIVPPTEIADLHTQVVAALQNLAQDSNKARDALRGKDKSAYTAALSDFKSQGQKLQTLGKQLTARGY